MERTRGHMITTLSHGARPGPCDRNVRVWVPGSRPIRPNRASRSSILIAVLFHFQINDPIWPHTLPWAAPGVATTQRSPLAALPESGSTISPLTSTASKSLPRSRRRSRSAPLSQRSSGAPDTNHAEPLSARIMP